MKNTALITGVSNGIGLELVKGKKLPSFKEVAILGYKSMMKGEKVAIHGFINNLQANLIRFLPKDLVLKIVRAAQDK
ncbi:MAG: hypothetical protein U0354_12695 [Candidatus Sericytochromatia bacterium]